MTTVEIAQKSSCMQVIAEDHHQIDAALDRVAALVDGPTRELLLAHDTVLGLLSRHLLGMEVAVCPVVARRLPDGRRAVRAHLMNARRLERSMFEMEQILWGDARAPRIPLETLQRRLVAEMTRHREDEERMLAVLDGTLSVDERSALAAKLQHATRYAPTRPHPCAVRRLGWTHILYRTVAGIDHFRDVLASRGVADPTYVRRHQRPVGLWGSYIRGEMLPPATPGNAAADDDEQPHEQR